MLEILFFTSKSCRPCQALYFAMMRDFDTWQERAFISEVDISLRVGGAVAMRHNVKSTPTLVVLNTDRKEIARLVGNVGWIPFMEKLLIIGK